MDNKIYLIEYKNNIIGTYLDYNLAELFIHSCFQNNFMEDNVKILTFQMNSCLYISSIYIDKKTKFTDIKKSQFHHKYKIRHKSKILDNTEQFENSDDTNKSKQILDYNDSDSEFLSDHTSRSSTETNNNFLNILNKKIELKHQLNLINFNKEKLEEAKQVYNIDIQLFLKFKDLIKIDPNFIIPELFQDKFKLFMELETTNNLSFDSFIANYHKENLYSNFPINEYEANYIDNKIDSDKEEFEISKSKNIILSEN